MDARHCLQGRNAQQGRGSRLLVEKKSFLNLKISEMGPVSKEKIKYNHTWLANTNSLFQARHNYFDRAKDTAAVDGAPLRPLSFVLSGARGFTFEEKKGQKNAELKNLEETVLSDFFSSLPNLNKRI